MTLPGTRRLQETLAQSEGSSQRKREGQYGAPGTTSVCAEA